MFAVLALGGVPLIFDLGRTLFRREFGSDLLGGIAIVTSVILGEYLAEQVGITEIHAPAAL